MGSSPHLLLLVVIIIIIIIKLAKASQLAVANVCVHCTVYRYVSNLVAWIYILLLPFLACIPAIQPATDLLLKIVQFPLVIGRNIKNGTMNIDSTVAESGVQDS